MRYLYITAALQGTRVQRDIPGTCSKEGTYYIGLNSKPAERQFRADFNCKRQHFRRIYL